MFFPAARVSDMHLCPLVEPGPVLHVGGPIAGPGAPSVVIGGLPAAVFGDEATCIGPPDKITGGSASVLFENKPAVRIGDPTAHQGFIMKGFPSVLIGDGSGAPTGQSAVLVAAAQAGRPFCEFCPESSQSGNEAHEEEEQAEP